MTSPPDTVTTTGSPLESMPAAICIPLRDWFAGQALVGLIPSPTRPGVLPLSPADMARLAYQYADSMMRERAG
jgi:hypothetical protein